MIMQPAGILIVALFGMFIVMGIVRFVSDAKAKKAKKDEQ